MIFSHFHERIFGKKPVALPSEVAPARRVKPHVEAVPLDQFETAWQAILAEGISKRMLLLIIDQYSYDRAVCSLAGATLLDRHFESLSIHELEMIFRTSNSVVQTRAADSILRLATHKNDLGQLVVQENVHQLTAARRTLEQQPELHDLCRCMEIEGVAEEAFALYQDRIRTRSVSREHAESMCHPARPFANQLRTWLVSQNWLEKLPEHIADQQWYKPLSWFTESEVRRLKKDKPLAPFELARCMDDGNPRIAQKAFEQYKQQILTGNIPPEHLYGMCHSARSFGKQLREWLNKEGVEYDLSDSIKLQIWAMMRTSNPQFAAVYVH